MKGSAVCFSSPALSRALRIQWDSERYRRRRGRRRRRRRRRFS
jgi:hypothetical protein